jgi:hypothetical protein
MACMLTIINIAYMLTIVNICVMWTIVNTPARADAAHHA